MKAQPYRVEKNAKGQSTYKVCDPEQATHVMLDLPSRTVILPVNGHRDKDGGPSWTWNKDTEKPTLKPSLLSRWTTGKENARNEVVCHSFITDGMVRFLSDSTHEHAGKTLPLLDIEA